MKSIISYVIVLIATMMFAYPDFADAVGNNAEQQAVTLVQKAENIYIEHPKEAEALLAEADKLNMNFPDSYRVWGELYEARQQWLEAADKYSKWAVLEPQSYKPLAFLGRLASEQKRYLESNNYLEKAKAIHATVGIINYRCYNFSALGQWQEAINECSEAIALDHEVNEYAYELRAAAYKAV